MLQDAADELPGPEPESSVLPEVGEDIQVPVQFDVALQEALQEAHSVETKDVPAACLGLDVNTQMLAAPVGFGPPRHIAVPRPIREDHLPRELA